MEQIRFRGDPKRLGAAEINRWNALVNQRNRGELRNILPPSVSNYDPSSRIAFCKNTSGSDRVAGETMAIEGLLWTLATDGTDDVILELVTADPDKAPAILLEPIEDDGFGRAVIDGPALAKIEIASSTSLRYATPQASSHSLLPASSGPIKLLAAPSAGAITLLPVVIGEGATSVVCITGGSGIAARSGTTISSATCTRVSRSSSTISTGSATVTVWNLSTTAVGNSVYIVAVPTNIGYVAVWEDC